MIKYGLSVPNFGEYSNINLLMKLAKDAEKAGWDGFFLWDHMYLSTRLEKNKQFGIPFTDPWIALTAIATVTKKIKFGTYVTVAKILDKSGHSSINDLLRDRQRTIMTIPYRHSQEIFQL